MAFFVQWCGMVLHISHSWGECFFVCGGRWLYRMVLSIALLWGNVFCNAGGGLVGMVSLCLAGAMFC